MTASCGSALISSFYGDIGANSLLLNRWAYSVGVRHLSSTSHQGEPRLFGTLSLLDYERVLMGVLVPHCAFSILHDVV